jgi:hypothetical protein
VGDNKKLGDEGASVLAKALLNNSTLLSLDLGGMKAIIVKPVAGKSFR